MHHEPTPPPKALVMDGRGGIVPRKPARILLPFTLPFFCGRLRCSVNFDTARSSGGAGNYFLGFLGRYPSGRLLRLLVGFFFWKRMAPSEGALILAIISDAA
jgi:hypothetical protein